MSKQKLNHTCVICGAKYHSCDTCEEIKTYTPWRTICDTQNHYLMYVTIRSYQERIISKETAKAQLEQYGVKNGEFNEFIPAVAVLMDEIFSNNKIKKGKDEKPASEDIVVEPEIEDVIKEDSEDIVEVDDISAEDSESVE